MENKLKEEIRIAEEKKRQEEEAKKKLQMQAVSSMRVSRDQVKGINWYYDKSSPKYTNANGFFLYIGEEDNSAPWLRLRIQYYADDWLFINKYTLRVDDKTYNISPGSFDVERDNNTMIWEWYDFEPGSYELDMIEAIINSNTAILRYEGDKYYDDRTITSAEKKALRNVLNAYEGLKNY